MKKSKFWLTLVAFWTIFLLAGCSNQNNSNSNSSSNKSEITTAYNKLMKKGKNYVDEKQYDKAAAEFKAAYKEKKTSVAKAYADQAENLNEAIKAIKKYDFNKALKELVSAKGESKGYSVLTRHAKFLYSIIDEIRNNLVDEIQPIYQQAKAAYDQKDFGQVEQKAEEILNLPYINTKYYKKIRSQAMSLFNKAKTAIANGQAAASSALANSSSKAKSSMMVGGQSVPPRVIAQVRDKLREVGVDTSNWTDQKVVDFMNAAAAFGHTTIESYTKQDVQAFLKK